MGADHQLVALRRSKPENKHTEQKMEIDRRFDNQAEEAYPALEEWSSNQSTSLERQEETPGSIQMQNSDCQLDDILGGLQTGKAGSSHAGCDQLTGEASQDAERSSILTLPDGRIAHLDAAEVPPNSDKQGGTLINDSSRALSYVSNGSDGKCHLYVLDPGEQSKQGVDVDGIVAAPKYQPVKGADGRYHALEIQAEHASSVAVVKIGDGTVARCDKSGNLITQREISSAPVAHLTEKLSLASIAEYLSGKQVAHAKVKNAAEFAGTNSALTAEPKER